MWALDANPSVPAPPGRAKCSTIKWRETTTGNLRQYWTTIDAEKSMGSLRLKWRIFQNLIQCWVQSKGRIMWPLTFLTLLLLTLSPGYFWSKEWKWKFSLDNDKFAAQLSQLWAQQCLSGWFCASLSQYQKMSRRESKNHSEHKNH